MGKRDHLSTTTGENAVADKQLEATSMAIWLHGHAKYLVLGRNYRLDRLKT